MVSGLLLGDRVLVRRTDFSAGTAPVEMQVRGRTLRIPPSPGRCQILTLKGNP